jgi:predicted HTH transcriptional regulator
LEFKAKAAHPEKIARELIAFANTKGGTLLVGVDDDKTISGCKYPEEEIYVITEHLATFCPQLNYELTRIPINRKKDVLAYYVPESANKPEFLKDFLNPNQRHAYVRVADKSIIASTEMEFVLRYEKDKRDVKFFYGKREEKIMQFLANQPQITLGEAQKLLEIPYKPTAITLVTLVRADLLQIIATEHGDIYKLKEGAFE